MMTFEQWFSAFLDAPGPVCLGTLGTLVAIYGGAWLWEKITQGDRKQ